MLFNSLEFWLFFVVFIVGYYLTKRNVRLLWCVIGSYVFYAWWDWRFLALITGLTGVNYLAGLAMAKSDDDIVRRRWVALSIVSSLTVLGFFKYFNFFIESGRTLLDALGIPPGVGTLEIILPVGISFYTFQALSYTIDLYRKEILVEKSLLRFATFIAFFPQLVAGPIVRASQFLPQLRIDHAPTWDNFSKGACMVAWGMVLKVVVADSLAPVVDTRFIAPEAMSSSSLVVGIVFYAFQIYGDFAGYSLMAIGFARVLGFEFLRNFDRPYFSTSFSEFWKRWHISLSSWLRDYLYVPLGGNRKGTGRTYVNLMTTMLLGGLWHGAAWTFVFWGGLHGFYLCLQRWFSIDGPLPQAGANLKRSGLNWLVVIGIACVGGGLLMVLTLENMADGRANALLGALLIPVGILALGAAMVQTGMRIDALFAVMLGRLMQGVAVFALVCLAWVFFRAETFADALTVIYRVTLADDFSFASIEQKAHVAKGMLLIGSLVLVEGASFRVRYAEIAERAPIAVPFFLIACLLSISILGTFHGNAFIYFQF